MKEMRLLLFIINRYILIFISFDCTPNIPKKYSIDKKPSKIPFPFLILLIIKDFLKS